MKQKPFVHLHVHTTYSLLDGACRIDELVRTAAGQDMPAVAITDHGVMYGVIDFYQQALKAGLQPIIGCEVYLTTGNRRSRTLERNRAQAYHMVLLATNLAGYENLVRLVSAAHLEGYYYKPRIDRELLAAHARGLIGLSGCLKGEVATWLLEGNLSEADRTARTYAEILGRENFFLEIQPNGLPEQEQANRLTAELSARTGLPLVATNDIHYLKREHAPAHEVLLCLQTQSSMSDPKRMRYPTDQFYFKTRADMEQGLPNVPGALDRTVEIAARCHVELEFGKPHFPAFPVPEGIRPRDYLEAKALEGIRRVYGVADPAHPANATERRLMERFHEEMRIIEATGFVNYFLVVWDFVRFARESGIPVGPGRGSGGGSVVAYALGITALDPLRYNLIFERFLNPARVSPPDFDIDFCQNRRGEVVEYVRRKYGADRVAHIITFNTLGAKMVIRDVGRVLEVPYSKCDQFARLVPEDPDITLQKALERNPEFRRAYDSDEDCRRILDYGFVLEGLLRNQSTHAAGIVISERPLAEIVPLTTDKEGRRCTQYDMTAIGELGLLKMDFLGLRTLTVLHETVELVRRHRGTELQLERIPLDDAATYALLKRADTVGVFQLESAGMRDLLQRVSADRIEDLIAVIALYRPGPLNMLPSYVERKTGKSPVRYEHPKLEPILKETYGIMLYQEQVQMAAQVLAGYSLAEGDELRRAMAKKKPEEMERHRGKFIEGCVRTSRLAPEEAERIFDLMAQFAEYGFNKSHSAGYAIIAYQTAYLKANYAVEFMSALLSSEIGDSNKLPVVIEDARRMGIEVRPPDVNASAARFRPEGNAIRFGLAGIKNVGEGAAEAIVTERERGGFYRGLTDFCTRLDSQTVNRKAIESLIRAGAFDRLDPNRARLLAALDTALAWAASFQQDRRRGQTLLFSDPTEASGGGEADRFPDCPPWRTTQILEAERELLGVYMSGHPLTQHVPVLRYYGLVGTQKVPQLGAHASVRLGGILTSVQLKLTRHKETMAIAKLEDLEGDIDVIVFPAVYKACAGCLQQDAVVVVSGEVSVESDRAKILAREVYPIEEVPRRLPQAVGLHIPAHRMSDEVLSSLRDILRRHRGSTPVTLCLQFPTGEKVFVRTDESFTVRADDALLRELDQFLGERNIYVALRSTPAVEPASSGPTQ